MPEFRPPALAVLGHIPTLRVDKAGPEAEEYCKVQQGGGDDGEEYVQVVGYKAKLLILVINPALFAPC